MVDSNVVVYSHNKQWNHGYDDASQPNITHTPTPHTHIAVATLDGHTHTDTVGTHKYIHVQTKNDKPALMLR